MYPASNLPSSSLRNHGLGVLCGTCKEYADCLYSGQVRNHGLGVLRGACKEYAAVPLLQTSQKSWSGCPPRHLRRVCGLPLLQTSQKSEWPGCLPRHLQQSMRTASAPDLFIQNQKSSLSRPVMNGFSYLYYDTVNLVSLVPLYERFLVPVL